VGAGNQNMGLDFAQGVSVTMSHVTS